MYMYVYMYVYVHVPTMCLLYMYLMLGGANEWSVAVLQRSYIPNGMCMHITSLMECSLLCSTNNPPHQIFDLCSFRVTIVITTE